MKITALLIALALSGCSITSVTRNTPNDSSLFVSDTYVSQEASAISFCNSSNEPVINIERNGDFYYKGKKIIQDKEVYQLMKKFLAGECKK